MKNYVILFYRFYLLLIMQTYYLFNFKNFKSNQIKHVHTQHVLCLNQAFVLYSHYKISSRAFCGFAVSIFQNLLMHEFPPPPHERGARLSQIGPIGLRPALINKMWAWSTGEMILTRENRRTQRKSSPISTLFKTNSALTDLVLSPDLLGNGPATDRLNHAISAPSSHEHRLACGRSEFIRTGLINEQNLWQSKIRLRRFYMWITRYSESLVSD
jgi:hypothetical protein